MVSLFKHHIKLKLKLFICLLLLFCILPFAKGNNVQVSNISIVKVNKTKQLIYIKFDISGENSWRTNFGAQNWDASWVFVKYRSGAGEWKHATLSPSALNYVNAAGATIDPVTDGKGVFIYASDPGIGNITSYNYTNNVIAWEYGFDGFDQENVTNLEIKLFAIEMVYVPEGSFYLGDGTSTYRFYSTIESNPAFISAAPVQVNSVINHRDDDQIEINGVIVDGDGGIEMDGILPVDNPDYPTGYTAFYCMKYEISQQQYVDFLNSISAAAAVLRTPPNNTYRNNVSDAGNHPNISTSTPYVPMNWLDANDLLAFLDWAALRPMTELEFEKACRGPNLSVSGEGAWGNITQANYGYAVSNLNNANETINNPSFTMGNVANLVTLGAFYGPVRCGIFASNNTSNSRVFAGASYYGIMELSGNLWEWTVTLGNADGRQFDGSHGDGYLVAGKANNANWPNEEGTNLGGGYRGRSFTDNTARVSDRLFSTWGYHTRDRSMGGRGVRGVNQPPE